MVRRRKQVEPGDPNWDYMVAAMLQHLREGKPPPKEGSMYYNVYQSIISRPDVAGTSDDVEPATNLTTPKNQNVKISEPTIEPSKKRKIEDISQEGG